MGPDYPSFLSGFPLCMPLFHACVVAINEWYILDFLDINAWLRLWAEREICVHKLSYENRFLRDIDAL